MILVVRQFLPNGAGGVGGRADGDGHGRLKVTGMKGYIQYSLFTRSLSAVFDLCLVDITILKYFIYFKIVCVFFLSANPRRITYRPQRWLLTWVG